MLESGFAGRILVLRTTGRLAGLGALSAGVNPAAVTNGSTEITTTGTTAAQIAADLAGMIAAITTAGPLVWIMKPKNPMGLHESAHRERQP